MSIENIVIRQVHKKDKNGIFELFNSVSKEDKKHLVLDQKIAVIRQNINQERHVFVAEHEGKIIGFARESGRPNKFVLLEELVVADYARGRCVGSMLLKYLLDLYPRMLAKTFATNHNMRKLLEKHQFIIDSTSPKGEILNWKHTQ
jgi:N-acetylglutamate synthase-like GNAT family acetyltransferase